MYFKLCEQNSKIMRFTLGIQNIAKRCKMFSFLLLRDSNGQVHYLLRDSNGGKTNISSSEANINWIYL